MNRLIEATLGFARAHKHDDNMPAWLTAMIVSGGRVLSVGYNSRANSGLQERYKTNPFCNSVHAEVDAVLNIRRNVVVRRLRADHEKNLALALAKPCTMCQAVLYAYGVKKAIYTISNNEFGVMRVVDPRI
jgi:deoxycytidylate deaminase